MLDVNISVDANRLQKLRDKAQKYPPYAITAGLEKINSYFENATFKQSMYPPSRSGEKFIWSSERQRRYVFANIDLPSARTYQLANAGKFTVNTKYFTIEYRNSAPYAPFVIHPSYQIIGHRTRGWVPVNQFIVNKVNRAPLMRDFKTAAIAAWDSMESFMFGGGAGL